MSRATAFLDRVLAEKRDEIARKKLDRPLSELIAMADTHSVRDFHGAISGGGRIIAELKRRTPSLERFENSARLYEMADIYATGGAAAISIVTDEKNFGTSLADVVPVRERTGLPVLVKEFVIDPYQIVEARANGADAVLLIVRILDWDRLTALMDLARELGMSVLVETHNEDELKTALQARARIVGINNRDLDALQTSLETTHRLARLVPDGVTLVSESGIHTRADIDALAASGAAAFLIGGALLASTDPKAKLAEFTGRQA